MTKWLYTARLYREPRVLGVLFLSFSSGLPFLLILATLHVWLKEVGVSKTTIGLFALVTLPYSLKFLWAPVLEQINIPFLGDVLGQRKGWMLASQLLLIPALILLGASNPSENILWTAMIALGVAFFSATQDILVEAYRVEILTGPEVGIGASMSNFGYRLGMWIAGAGALSLASYFDWNMVYKLMAACMGVGIIATLLSPDPPLSAYTQEKHQTLMHLKENFRQTIAFLKNENDWPLIILFILSYKLADTALNVMSAPFLLEIGFSKLEIAHVAKSFGIGAMVVGGLFSGFLLSQRPLRQVLCVCAILQVFSSFMFSWQALVGHDIILLFSTIGLENFSCGLGAAAFIAYLSHLSHHRYAATHFALLTSFASLCRVFFSYGAGWIADHVSWLSYFTLAALACGPFLFLAFSQGAHINRLILHRKFT
jgi:PAT family beta-lactamase induction signal transducer AmpG